MRGGMIMRERRGGLTEWIGKERREDWKRRNKERKRWKKGGRGNE